MCCFEWGLTGVASGGSNKNKRDQQVIIRVIFPMGTSLQVLVYA